MKQILFSLLLAVAVGTTVLAQTPLTDKGKRSDEIQIKVHKIELMAQLLPVGFTKAQLAAILPRLEKIRAEQKKVMASEDEEIAKIEAKVDAMLKNAVDKAVYPPQADLAEIRKVGATLAIRRNIVLSENVDQLYDELKKHLNAGQMTVMAKTVEAKAIDPNKPDEVKDEPRIKAYIRAFLLDPLAYDLLVKLSQTVE